MGNQLVKKPDIMELYENQSEELKHYGVLGMKWGVRRANRKAMKLEKKTRKTIRRYDKGKLEKDELDELSRKVRSTKFKFDKKVRRAERWLAKAQKADSRGVVNRFNKDPEKRKMVEDYMNSIKESSTTLAELRLQLVDARL